MTNVLNVVQVPDNRLEIVNNTACKLNIAGAGGKTGTVYVLSVIVWASIVIKLDVGDLVNA
jgi:hypothetical protein